MLSEAASSTIFWVFGMTRPGIEPRSPGPLANTLLIRLMARYYVERKTLVIFKNWFYRYISRSISLGSYCSFKFWFKYSENKMLSETELRRWQGTVWVIANNEAFWLCVAGTAVWGSIFTELLSKEKSQVEQYQSMFGVNSVVSLVSELDVSFSLFGNFE